MRFICNFLLKNILFGYALLFPFIINAQLNKTEVLNGTWRFIKQSNTLALPDDTDWEEITIPHTWNILDGQSGGGKDEWQNNGYYRGPGTYTCRFNYLFEKGKRIYIRFEAVSQEAEVFLNGIRLGAHKGAFNAFIFDITDAIRNGENRLVVNATNVWNKDIAPLGGDFTLFGGIYRPVWFITKKEVGISPMNYASSGLYLKQKRESDSTYTIDATTIIMNESSKKQRISVVVTLYSREGKMVAHSKMNTILERNSTKPCLQKFKIERPVLWQGIDNPYLYRALIQVFKGSVLADTLTQYLGFRSFSIDSIKGAFLNGKPYKIRGVNRHQDRKGMGWAITNKEHDEDMAMINEIGANGLRLAHYPHCNYTYSLADKYGFLVWAEIPLVNNITGSLDFAENAKLQLTELILQNYNHPSIVFWSIYNEMGHRKTANPHQLLTDLNNLAHTLDPTRLTVAAPNLKIRPEKMIPDEIAFNSYPGWYGGKPEDMKQTLMDWNKSVGYKGIGVSEYGAGGSIHHHEQGITIPPKHNGNWHPEEYQSYLHEVNYKYIKETDWCWGSFVWNMFDFASAGRVEGDTVGVNDKGLVTYDRKIRKDAFYYYKANWNPEPMVYITSRRHLVRNSATSDVKVYSNCEILKLYINDTEQEAVKGSDCIFIWKNVQLIQGRNQIKVIAQSKSKTVMDECVWEVL